MDLILILHLIRLITGDYERCSVKFKVTLILFFECKEFPFNKLTGGC